MTASVDPLTDDLARLVEGFVYSGGQNGPVLAAMAVLGHQTVRDGMEALRRVQDLREHHQWRETADSTWRSCSCGVLGCSIPDALR